jgi:hypothetical protein
LDDLVLCASLAVAIVVDVLISVVVVVVDEDVPRVVEDVSGVLVSVEPRMFEHPLIILRLIVDSTDVRNSFSNSWLC